MGWLRLCLFTTVVQAVKYDFGASYGIGPGSSSSSTKNAASKYKSISATGEGNGRGIDEATLRTLRRGVDLGKPNSLYYMGLICFYGEGLPMDRRLSVKYFRQAAEAGHWKIVQLLLEAGADASEVRELRLRHVRRQHLRRTQEHRIIRFFTSAARWGRRYLLEVQPRQSR